MKTMRFDFILIAFSIDGIPPDAGVLKNWRKDYFLAPLSQAGAIYTADVDLWPSRNQKEVSAKTFCPTRGDVEIAWRRAKDEDCVFLMGLTDQSEFDPPASPGVHLPLESASNVLGDNGALEELGFDVIDQYTGLSGLANVGYSAADIEKLRSLAVATNHFNLFTRLEDAVKFSAFASSAAPEHAPFIPLRIVARLQGRSK